MKNTYIIRSINDKDEELYYSIDHSSGGYPFWSSSISDAVHFQSIEEAVHLIKTSTDFTRNDETISVNSDDRYINSPRLIYDAVGICNNKTHGYTTISVCELSLKTCMSEIFEGFRRKKDINRQDGVVIPHADAWTTGDKPDNDGLYLVVASLFCPQCNLKNDREITVKPLWFFHGKWDFGMWNEKRDKEKQDKVLAFMKMPDVPSELKN